MCCADEPSKLLAPALAQEARALDFGALGPALPLPELEERGGQGGPVAGVSGSEQRGGFVEPPHLSLEPSPAGETADDEVAIGLDEGALLEARVPIEKCAEPTNRSRPDEKRAHGIIDRLGPHLAQELGDLVTDCVRFDPARSEATADLDRVALRPVALAVCTPADDG